MIWVWVAPKPQRRPSSATSADEVGIVLVNARPGPGAIPRARGCRALKLSLPSSCGAAWERPAGQLQGKTVDHVAALMVSR